MIKATTYFSLLLSLASDSLAMCAKNLVALDVVNEVGAVEVPYGHIWTPKVAARIRERMIQKGEADWNDVQARKDSRYQGHLISSGFELLGGRVAGLAFNALAKNLTPDEYAPLLQAFEFVALDYHSRRGVPQLFRVGLRTEEGGGFQAGHFHEWGTQYIKIEIGRATLYAKNGSSREPETSDGWAEVQPGHWLAFTKTWHKTPRGINLHPRLVVFAGFER